MAANRRQLDGDQAWRKWKPGRSKLEANSNVCCHGRGMLQWDPEKVKPKRLGGSADGVEEALDLRARIATFDNNPTVPLPASLPTASPEAEKKAQSANNKPFIPLLEGNQRLS
jgi:hypothetical protein